MNDWLAAAPQATVVQGSIGCMVSIGDMADRAPRSAGGRARSSTSAATSSSGSTRRTSRTRWEAGVLYDHTTRTLFCGDLFSCIGDVRADDHRRHRRSGESPPKTTFPSMSLHPASGSIIRGLARARRRRAGADARPGVHRRLPGRAARTRRRHRSARRARATGVAREIGGRHVGSRRMTRDRSSGVLAAAVLVVLALVVGGCSSSSDDEQRPAQRTATAPSTTARRGGDRHRAVQSRGQQPVGLRDDAAVPRPEGQHREPQLRGRTLRSRGMGHQRSGVRVLPWTGSAT